MAETSKNKIYYNDDENSIADILTDMKRMAESTDNAIETKVDKVSGKVLSSNDFTNEYKQKVDNMKVEIPIASNKTLGGIKVGQNLTIDSDGTLNAKVESEGGVTGDTLPIGSIVSYGGLNAPENWLICDGSEISRTEYLELYNVLGTIYGKGDGSATFNLPDLKDKFILGTGNSHISGETGGEEKHTLTESEIPTMNVYMTKTSWYDKGGLEYGGAENRRVVAGGAAGGDTGYAIGTVNGGNQSHNNMPPYATTIFIIKARQRAGVVATVVDNLNNTSALDALSAKQGKILNDKITTNSTYSTEEVVVGTYMGKAKYRKTIVMSNVTETNKTYDLSSLSVETCMINSSHSYFEQGNYQIPIGCYGGTTDYSRAFYQKNTKTLYVQFGTTYTMSKNIHITIEYTKTTDSVV